MTIPELQTRFFELYGTDPSEVRVFSSPGRVNLIGEHTDYNGGYVLPAALMLNSTVLARPRKDRKINLIAADLNRLVEADLDTLDTFKTLKWGNYQLGVADELQKAGYELPGCDLLYHDTVPLGGGLSSSAAIQIATAVALVSLANGPRALSPEGKTVMNMQELALIAQKSEHNYVGVKCGIMDQFSSALGKKDHALFLDCKTLEYRLIPLKLDGIKIVITNTNRKRSLADSKYNERRGECEQGLALLQSKIPSAGCLGDISPEQFSRFGEIIRDETLRKRVRHVITENERVLRSVEAIGKGDLAAFGNLLIQSHESLRDDYEVSCRELDVLVEEALKIDGVIGSRMTGAGFGGCTVSLVSEETVDLYREIAGRTYSAATGLKADFYITEPGDGGREIIL